MKQSCRIIAFVLAFMLNITAVTGIAYAETPEETIERLEKEVDVLAEANKLLTEAIAALTEANKTLKEVVELLKSGTGSTAGGAATNTTGGKPSFKKASDPIKSVYSAAEREQIAKLDLDEAKKLISTVEDAVYYLSSFGYMYYTTSSSRSLELSLDHAKNKFKGKAVANDMVTALTAFFLADDYTDLGYVGAPVVVNGNSFGLCALYIKHGEKYQIVSPSQIWCENIDSKIDRTSFTTTTVDSLSNLKTVLKAEKKGKGEDLIQIITAKYQEKLNFPYNNGLLTKGNGEYNEVYRLSDEAIAKAAAEKARETLVTLEKTLKSKGFTSKGLTLSIDEVMALVGSGLENVKNKCKSLEDVLFFLAATGSKQASGDIQTKDSSGAYTWHFNYSVREVYQQNTSNCGATASYVAYLLHGDYEEVGLLTMRGENGGHVINYVKDNGVYFTVDVNSYHGSSYNVNSMGYKTAADLITAGQNAAKRYPYYSAFATKWTSSDPTDGDVPVGWDSSKLVRIPNEYKTDTVIVLEDPAAGYTFEWVDVSKNTWAKIDALRNG